MTHSTTLVPSHPNTHPNWFIFAFFVSRYYPWLEGSYAYDWLSGADTAYVCWASSWSTRQAVRDATTPDELVLEGVPSANSGKMHATSQSTNGLGVVAVPPHDGGSEAAAEFRFDILSAEFGRPLSMITLQVSHSATARH